MLSFKYLFRRLCIWLADTSTPCSNPDIPNKLMKGWEKKNRWLRRAGMKIDANVAIGGGLFVLPFCEGNVVIREHAVIGHNLRVFAFNAVEIGKYCMFAADITLVNGGHDKNTFEPFSGPLVIGNGCWVGNGARIVGALTVGDNSIVAAGAVVVNDVPPCSIVAGVPAKVIRYRDLPDKVWHLGNTWFSPYTFESV